MSEPPSFERLLDALLRYPPFQQEKDARTSLLVNVPGGSFVSRSSNAISDLQNILDYAHAVGRIEGGEWALERVRRNFARVSIPGTELGKQIEAEFQAVLTTLKPGGPAGADQTNLTSEARESDRERDSVTTHLYVAGDLVQGNKTENNTRVGKIVDSTNVAVGSGAQANEPPSKDGRTDE
jgi:hypothetical protein